MNALIEKFVHGGNIYKGKAAAGEWLDFSANINPLGLPKSVEASILANLGGLVHYPDPEAAELKAAITDYYEVPEQEIVLGNGAAELLYVFFQLFRPQKVLLPVPSFSEYERAARSAQAEICYAGLSAEQNFAMPWQEIFHQLPVVDAVVFGNPNNPTGQMIPAGEMEICIRKAAESNTWVLVDESFMDFRSDAACYTVRNLVQQYDNLFVLQSMTKFFAIPGLRLGFGLLPPEAAVRMELGKDVWNVNLLAQKAGTAALADFGYQQLSRELLTQEISYVTAELKKLDGLRFFEPGVNFILLDLAGCGITVDELLQQMRARSILLRDCRNYPGLAETFVRMAVRSHEENRKVLEAFEEIWQGRQGK